MQRRDFASIKICLCRPLFAIEYLYSIMCNKNRVLVKKTNPENYTKSRHTSSVGSKNWFINYCRLYIFLYPRSKGCNFSNLRPHLTYTVQYCTSCALTGRILLRHACQLASVRGAHDLLDSRYVKADVSCPSTAQLAAVALPG